MQFFWLVLFGSSHAQALETERRREGEYVYVSAVMPHDPAAVRSIFQQHRKTMKLGSAVRSVEVTPLSNGCSQVVVVNRGFAKDLAYTAERCPTEFGWHSQMTSSEDFEEHDILWEAKPHAKGSVVSIRVKVALKYPVPKFLVQRIVTGALEDTLKKVDKLLSVAVQEP